MRIKKSLKVLALMLVLLMSFSSVAMAAMPNNTIIFGTKAYDLSLLNDATKANEILAAFVAAGNSFVYKTPAGALIDANAATVLASTLPAVEYKDAAGVATNYAAADGSVVVTTATITGITGTNGTINVVLSAAPTTAPVQGDFALGTWDGTTTGAVTVTGFTWTASTKTAAFTVTPMAGGAAAVSFIYGASYKSGTTAWMASADTITVPAAVATLSSVTATNGTISAVLSLAPSTAPILGDFTFTKAVDGAAAAALTVAGFTWDATSKTAAFTFTAEAAGAAAKSVVVAGSYKTGTAVAATAFTVAAATKVVTTVVITTTAGASVAVPATTTLAAEVRDQFGAAMTGQTVTWATSDATKATVADGVVTAVAAGSANITATCGTVSSTAYAVTVTADVTRPTATVTVIDATHLQVVFSEKMNVTNAQTIANNYAVRKISNGADDAAPTAAVLASDGKTLTLTLGAALVPANYVLKFNTAVVGTNLSDLAGNLVVANTEAAFVGQAATDTTGPSLTLATYNTGTRILALTFSEVIDIGATKVDMTKITLGGVTLGSGETIALSAGTTYNVTVSTAKAAEVNAVTAALTITLAAGAVKDTATTPNNNVLISAFDVSRTTPPVAQSATYTELTNRLVVTFDQAVKYTPVDWTKITVTVNGTSTTLATGTMKSTANGSTLDFELTAANATTIEGAAGTVTTGTIAIAAAGITSATNVTNLAHTGVALTYVQDTAAPTISSVQYNTETNLMTVTFSETINYATVDATKLSLQDGTTTVALAAANVPAGTSGTTMAFDIANVGNNISDRIEDESSVGGGADLDLSKTKLVLAASHNLADMQGNALATNTYATGAVVTVLDYNQPKVSAAAAIDALHVDVTFTDEKGINLDATTANTATNYSVALTSNPSQTVGVSAAVLQPNGKTVRLTLATAQTFVAGYTITVTNVKDGSSNVVKAANSTAAYNSTAALDTTKPVVNTVAATTIAGPDNDTVVITFSEDVDQTSATNRANFKVEFPVDTQLALNADNSTITYTPNATTITLKGGMSITTGQNVKVTVTGIVDKAGNAIDTSAAANYIKTVAAAGDSTLPTISAVTGATGTSEDSITITFSEAMQEATAEIAGNFVFESPTATVITATPTSMTYTYASNTARMVVAFPAGTLTPAGSVTVKSANPNTVKDLAGNNMNTAQNVAGTNSDGVAPTIAAVAGKTVLGGLDQILVTFSEPMNAVDAATKANFAIESPTGTVISLANLDGADIAYNAGTRTTTISLDTSSATNGYDVADLALKNSQTVKVTVSNVKDVSGNVIAASSVRTGTVNDAANDVLAGALDTPGTKVKVTGSHSVEFSWDEALDSSTLATSDFTLAVGATSYPITAVDIDATKMIVTLTTSRTIAIAEAGLALTVASGGSFTDLAGNAITAIDGDNTVAVQAYTVPGGLTLVGAQQTASIGQDLFVRPGETAAKISDLFKLTAGATDGMTIDTLVLGATMGTATLSEFTNVKLFYSDDVTVGDADDVQVGATLPAALATMTFSGINKHINATAVAYFYLKADVASATSTADTITIDIKVGATAVTDTTQFVLTSTGTNAGTAVTVDADAAQVPNAGAPAAHATDMVVTLNATNVTDRSYIYIGTTQINTGADTKASWTVANTLSGPTAVTSITMNAATGVITIVLPTAAGGVFTGSLKINFNQLTDGAGNACVNDTTAANTVLTIIDGGGTWTATWGPN